MDQSWLLSTEKKKESTKGFLSTLGIFVAICTVLIFSTLFFADISLCAEGTLSLSLSFFLLFISSYMMYVSLFETGKGQGEREATYLALFERRTLLFERLRAEGNREGLSAFCRALSVRETKAERARLLDTHFLTESEYAALAEAPRSSLPLRQRRALRAIKKQKAAVISVRALLAEQPYTAHRAPLFASPERCRRRRTLAFLLPLALFTALSVSIAFEVMLHPSANAVVGYLLKLFTLLQSGVKGFRAGFYHTTADKCDYMREQCEILEEYLKEEGTKTLTPSV